MTNTVIAKIVLTLDSKFGCLSVTLVVSHLFKKIVIIFI